MIITVCYYITTCTRTITCDYSYISFLTSPRAVAVQLGHSISSGGMDQFLSELLSLLIGDGPRRRVENAVGLCANGLELWTSVFHLHHRDPLVLVQFHSSWHLTQQNDKTYM